MQIGLATGNYTTYNFPICHPNFGNLVFEYTLLLLKIFWKKCPSFRLVFIKVDGSLCLQIEDVKFTYFTFDSSVKVVGCWEVKEFPRMCVVYIRIVLLFDLI